MKYGRILFNVTYALSVCLGASATNAFMVYSNGDIVPLDEVPTPSKSGATKQLKTNNVTFNITYTDVDATTGVGFDDAMDGADRRARLEDALAYVGEAVGEAGTLDVLVNASQTDATGFLAAAGTGFDEAVGYQNGSAFFRLENGFKQFASPEIGITVDFGYTWNSGIDAPLGTEYDLISVLVHEVTHGMGILSLSDANGDNAFTTPFPGAYSVWDSFLARNTGDVTLFSGAPPAFQGITADLISNDLVFSGPSAGVAFASRPPIYAPNPFRLGSSLSHWKTGSIPGGAVMEHAISRGEEARAYADFEVAALQDLGWSNATLPLNPAGYVPPEGGQITLNLTLGFIQEGDLLTMTAPAGSNYQWIYNALPLANDAPRLSGVTAQVLTFDPVLETDAGAYTCAYDTPAKATVETDPLILTVLGAGSLPVGGIVGLAGLSAALLAAYALRRKK